MKVFFLFLTVCGVQFFMLGCAHQKFHEPAVTTFKMTPVPLNSASWNVVYDGGGKVEFNPDGSGDLIFQPQAAQTPSQTFAALILLKDSLVHPLKNYAVKIEVTTEQQIRKGNPNDWETFWFFGNYQQSNPAQKTANYFMQKPKTGIELGRAFESVGQQFLKTDPVLKSEIGTRNIYVLVKREQHFVVYKNDEVIFDYDGEAKMPKQMYNQPGALGLYSEDAKIRIHSFSYQAL